jgi:hypothetical protein
MQGNVILSAIEPDNTGKPHVQEQLIKLIRGKQSFTRTERKKMREHLAVCLECQSFFGEFLIESVAYDRVNGSSEVPARKLLAQLESIMHKRLKEDIPAYVETLEKFGENQANSKYRILAGHLVDCQDCRSEMTGVQSWLRQAVQEGLIEPFEVDTRSR